MRLVRWYYYSFNNFHRINRRKIRLIESYAKCRHRKIFTYTGTLRRGVYLSRTPPLLQVFVWGCLAVLQVLNLVRYRVLTLLTTFSFGVFIVNQSIVYQRSQSTKIYEFIFEIAQLGSWYSFLNKMGMTLELRSQGHVSLPVVTLEWAFRSPKKFNSLLRVFATSNIWFVARICDSPLFGQLQEVATPSYLSVKMK